MTISYSLDSLGNSVLLLDNCAQQADDNSQSDYVTIIIHFLPFKSSMPHAQELKAFFFILTSWEKKLQR